MVTVSRPQSAEEFKEYYDLRWRLLRQPWGQPRGSEKDELEAGSHHVTVRDENGRLLGIGRLHLNNDQEAQIRYMAIEEDAQGRGIGRAIMESLESIARELGARVIALDAREHAVGFYERFAYRVVGAGPTKFDAIKHSKMELCLDQQPAKPDSANLK